MSKAKTQATAASVDEYLASHASPDQLADCQVLMAMLGRVTGEAPRMWGPSIVGYGRYAYRGRDLVVYLVAESPRQEALLARLGKHKFGKACLYLKRLADVDLAVLESLVTEAVAEVRRRHPATGQD
jgi:Domain of unknown function (DU1801)